MKRKSQTTIDWQKTGQRMFEAAAVASGAYVFARAVKLPKTARAGLTLSALYLWAVARHEIDKLERQAALRREQSQPRAEIPPRRDSKFESTLREAIEIVDARSTLGVEWPATVDEIRSAFRRKVIRIHPDHGGDEDETRELIRARDVLLAYAEKCDEQR